MVIVVVLIAVLAAVLVVGAPALRRWLRNRQSGRGASMAIPPAGGTSGNQQPAGGGTATNTPISADIIMQAYGGLTPTDKKAEVSFPRLSPTQQAGMKLALGVGIAIAAVTIFTIVWAFSTKSAAISPTPLVLTDSNAPAVIASYKSLRDEPVDQALRLFDAVVVRAFLPVFTAILGYIFASQTAARVNANQGTGNDQAEGQ